ncbi:hypothetical protein niasHT_002761 [Heterodera trifolii]|uniref:Uncharacterized protein n=1 Tax=Heterodera trifolii TaxID=157864 RepID=A0ABD2M873_9BILA
MNSFEARDDTSMHGTGGTLQQQQQPYRMEMNYRIKNMEQRRSNRVDPMAPGQPQPAQIPVLEVTPVENVNGRPGTSMARF